MAWVRLDDTFPEHPKVLAAGGDAAWLHVCALAYCNRHATDGFVPSSIVSRLSDRRFSNRLAERLVDVSLWRRCDDGYEINDYLEYQMSRAEMDERRAQKAEAGRKGGLRSGEVRRSRTEAGASGFVEAETNPNPTQPNPLEVKTADNSKSVPAEPPRSPSYARQVTARAAELRMAARATQPDDPDAWCAATSKAMLVEREQQIRDAYSHGLDVESAARMLVGDVKPARDPEAELRSARRFGASVKDMHWRDAPADLRDEYRTSFINELPYEGREATDPVAWAAAALEAYDAHEPQIGLRAV